MNDSDLLIDLENSVNTSNIEEVPLTASEVIQLMEEAWLNEKFAPEVLPHKSVLVECLLGQINFMRDNICSTDGDVNFQLGIHLLELDRLRFLVTSYLRTRLKKIETFAFSLLKEEDQRIEKNEDAYLTKAEYEFAKRFAEGISQHFEEVLDFLPGVVVDDWKHEPVKPNMNSFVFLKSKKDIEGVVIDEDLEDSDLVDFKKDSQLLISYNSVANLVKNSEVHLI